MAVYLGALNYLIPRGTIGGAGQQPRIKPTIIVLHTNASNTSIAGAASLMKNTTKGQEFHFQQEASGTGRVAGRLAQYVDTSIRADNNYKVNSFVSGGVLCGAISIETADHGTPYELSWTDLGQRKNLEDLVVWLCQTHGIPARRCPGPFEPGIGYHSIWGYNTSSNMNVNPWTNAVGKICPGPGKIREFPDLLAAVARRVAGGAEEEPVTPAEIEAVSTKAAQKVWDTMIANVSAPGADPVAAKTAMAYVLRNTAATYLGTDPAGVTTKQDLDQLELAVADLTKKVEALGTGGGTIDVAALAEAVADEMAARLNE
jgi:hypothetical protein